MMRVLCFLNSPISLGCTDRKMQWPHTLKRQLYKNAAFSYSDTHRTNAEEMKLVLRGESWLYFVRLPLWCGQSRNFSLALCIHRKDNSLMSVDCTFICHLLYVSADFGDHQVVILHLSYLLFYKQKEFFENSRENFVKKLFCIVRD